MAASACCEVMLQLQSRTGKFLGRFKAVMRRPRLCTVTETGRVECLDSSLPLTAAVFVNCA